MLDSYVYEYTIMTPTAAFTFAPFVASPNFCEISYTYQIDSAQGFEVISEFDA